MRLVVFSHKLCWPSPSSPSGYATDGGFPFQMQAISELFDATTLVVPCETAASDTGLSPLIGKNLTVSPLTPPAGRGLRRKFSLLWWLVGNSPRLLRAVRAAEAVHAPIPGDIGTFGMLLAFLLRKPLFVRHCGNWFVQTTTAEHFWRWFIERFAGGRNVMLATGGNAAPPSRNRHVHWIFSTSLSEDQLKSCLSRREAPGAERGERLIIACRQDKEKGTGTVIESLPLILRDFPHATLDVVGDGYSLKEFERMAEELGVGARITFHGKVDHPTVISLFRRADLFCYPTAASEGFPKVVLEALACGLPVVTTRVSVLPELIGRGCGLLLDEVRPETIARAVREILSDSEGYRAMSRKAFDTAREYSLERWGNTIGEMLRTAWERPLRSDA